MTAESLYTYSEDIPPELNNNVKNLAVRNRVDTKLTHLPEGAAITLRLTVNGQEWDGDWGNTGGWGHYFERPENICWIWENSEDGQVPETMLVLRMRVEAGGQNDVAQITLIPPPDVWGQRVSPTAESEEHGKDKLLRPAQSGEEEERVFVDATPGRHQSGGYLVKFRSIADARYILMVRDPSGAAICQYFDISGGATVTDWTGIKGTDIADWSQVNKTDITAQITSSQGYQTPVVEQGTTYAILVAKTPVGRDAVARERRIRVEVGELSNYELTYETFQRFDAVTCRCGAHVPPLQESWGEK